MKMRDSWLRRGTVWLLLAVLMMLTCRSLALAEGEQVPMESRSPYRVVLTVPGGWSNSNSATVQVSITDKDNLGWYRIEYRMNESSWIDCENQFAGGKAGITVRENGTFTLRITDPHGQRFEESAQVGCIDLTAPVLSATINGTTLQIEARDDLSGVAGVQVNSMLFTTLTGGILNVQLDETMNRFEKLAVRAFDYAGNFTEPLSLDNPYYTKPADPTPTPTATSKATKKPANEVATAKPAATQTVAVTSNPYQGLGSSLIYVYDEPDPTAVPTTAPTPEPIIQTEYITIGPGMPYQADGNSHTLDVLYSAATNKQFITLQSKNGNTFYLVIDYDKPIDEEAEMYETYFLNLVDERDLLALMSEDEREEVPTPTPEIIYVTPVPTAVPAVTATPAPAEPEAPLMSEQMKAMLALAAIAGLAVVGILVFLKGKRDGARARADNDFELDDDEDEQNEE